MPRDYICVDNTENSKENLDDDKSILEIAKRRFLVASEAEIEIRALALEDTKFRAGEQWDESVKKAREEDQRPCLTINRLPQYIRQITNDQRQNRPSIKVNPVDDKADVETAKVLQGIIRHIEYDSNADVAYDTGFNHAATGGFGYVRVISEYCDPYSFNQQLKIKSVPNQFSVYLDPNYQEPDGSDANYGFVFIDMNKDDFKAQYPKSELSQMEDWRSLGDNDDWIKKDSVRIAEYYYKTFEEITIVQLSDGLIVEESQLPPALPPEITILNKRKSLKPVVKWVKMNGIEILEKTDWVGQWIPIIPILGDQIIVDGKKILEGVIRHAKDPQRMYNYWASSETETIALAPRAPFIAAEGQLTGYEAIWKTANRKNHAYLPYKPTSINGTLVAPPQRNVFEAPVQAITNARIQSSEDIKATTGIYDASLGSRSSENSGVAIQRRNMQSQTNNFHLIDNLTRSIRHVGRILVEAIPYIYDTPQVIRIMNEDGSVEMATINEMFEAKGKIQGHILSNGKYDVTASAGPSYQTKRQEAVASMLSFIQSYPAAAQVIGDLLAKNMDWPGADQIAERLKKTLPPGIAEEKDQDHNQMPVPPEAQAQMQQMQQMIEMLTNQLNEASDTIKNKKMELESKERIEFSKMEVDLKKEAIKYQGQAALISLKEEILDINRRLELLNINAPIDEQNYEILGDSSGAEMPVMNPNEQQLTGEFSPGLPME